ncbi:peroxisomal assembly protein [Puttea exsequens]|nr:peroxisomal assembly protein [Puttea exsequens]
MDYHNNTADHRKRRRRRRADRVPIFAQLILSEQIKGNAGRISPELYDELYGIVGDLEQTENGSPAPRYVAITPSLPVYQDSLEDSSWTLLPVLLQKDSSQKGDSAEPLPIYFPAASLALQGFAETLKATSAGRAAIKGKGVEIRMLDVEPLILDTVYVTVDGDALDKHEEVQKTFGGGFASSRMNGTLGKGKRGSVATMNADVNGDGESERDDKLTTAICKALETLGIVRQNDMLPLPLPAHPITHVPLPPARISLCEPVNQGLLSDATEVIVNRISHKDPADRGLPSIAAQKTLRGMIMENGYDTSSDHFVSAVEEVENNATASPKVMDTTSDSNNSQDDSDDSSEDSMDNIISMNAPQLPLRSSGVLSSSNAATPRLGRSMLNGISTPGSVFSNFTATTARQGNVPKGKLFKAEGLLRKLPDELLHPKPAMDEDEEARVFVDIKTLMKVGCFSGDWVKIEGASAPSNDNNSAWSSQAFVQEDNYNDFRPAKIYGLPDISSPPKMQYQRTRTGERRSSIVSMPGMESPGLKAWLSPILLANYGHPTHIRLAPIVDKTQGSHRSVPPQKRAKINATSSPPIAKEMTILRVSTPLSTERALQTGIFAALKQHFESKKRILRQGDMIALPIDVEASRLLAQPAASSDAYPDLDELLALSSNSKPDTTGSLDIAWFRVGQIISSEFDEGSQDRTTSFWGHTACIEPSTTRMRQVGSEISKIPSILNNSWPYYLGVRPPVKNGFFQNPVFQYVTTAPKLYVTPLRRRLRELFAAATSPRALHLGMDPMVILLRSTQRHIGKSTLAFHAAFDLGLHVFDVDAYEILAEGGSAGDVKSEALLKARIERAMTCGISYTIVLVRHLEALTADRIAAALKDIIPEMRVLIATTTEIENIPENMRSLFTHELDVSAPDEGEREGVLQSVLEERGMRLAHDVDLASIAVKTAALVAGDLTDVAERALVARQDRIDHLLLSGTDNSGQIMIRDILVSGGEGARTVTKADFDIAIEAARKNFADAIGAPKIPNVSWDDVGGLENVKDAVMETIQLPLERPELFAKGMKKRSGILFYGPPGTGKTLLAKAIATEFSLNFFSVKGPELLNMYIGESEANVRRVFQRARDARPCVVFFDELDSVAPKRGNQGDSGGVMDRIVSQLLAELDGMSDGEDSGSGVFVIGATNRPDLLDQALLRPGRFDKMLYLGVSDTHAKQLTILEALTRKFTMHPNTSLRRVAESMPFTYTGADLYALASDAMLKAITRQANAVDAKIKSLPTGPVTTAYFFDHMATEEDIAIMVTEEDFYAANKELVGSVRYALSSSFPSPKPKTPSTTNPTAHSAKELEHYQRVRHTFEGSSTAASSSQPKPHSNPPTTHLQLPQPALRPKPKSHASNTGKASAKRKGKGKGTGKGKATRWDSDDDDDDDDADDDAYVTSSDYLGTLERRGSVHGNGNGTADGFGDVGGDDDADVYG